MIGLILQQAGIANKIPCLTIIDNILLTVLIGFIEFDLTTLHEIEIAGIIALIKNLLFARIITATLVSGKLSQLSMTTRLIDKGRKAGSRAIELTAQAFTFIQSVLNHLQELILVDRLGEIIIRPEVHPPSEIFALCLSSKKNKRYPCGSTFLAKDLEHTEAIEFGHHHIAKNEVGRAGESLFDPDLTVVGLFDSIAGQLEDFTKIFPYLGIIFN